MISTRWVSPSMRKKITLKDNARPTGTLTVDVTFSIYERLANLERLVKELIRRTDDLDEVVGVMRAKGCPSSRREDAPRRM